MRAVTVIPGVTPKKFNDTIFPKTLSPSSTPERLQILDLPRREIPFDNYSSGQEK